MRHLFIFFTVAILALATISVNAEITEVGFYDDRPAHRLHVADDLAYLAGGDLTVVDVSDPENPEEIGFIDTPIGAVEVAISGNMAFVADNNSYLRAIDISDPANPEEIGSYETPDGAQAVEIINDLAFIAVHQFGLLVIDISDPEHMVEVGRYNPGGRPYGMAVRDELAYIADLNGLLHIIDISDPENPDEIGSVETPGAAQDVFVLGNYAYVASDHDGLCVIDISDPEDPSEVGSYDTPGQSYSVVVVDSYAFIADYGSGLRVIDVSDPEDLDEAGFHDTPGQSYGIEVIGELAYVADGEGGLRILDISDFISRDDPNLPEDVTWWIHLTANVGNYYDDDNYVGGAEEATFDFDEAFDFPEPPHAPDRYIQLYFPHPDWENDLGDDFTSDIVPEDAQWETIIVWDFEVNTDQEDQVVTLGFDYNEDIDQDFNLVLLDVEAEETVDLWENDSYEYNAGEGGVNEFQLIYGDLVPPEVIVTEPNGGENLHPTDIVNIAWEAEDLTGVVESVIFLSIDRGETWMEIGSTVNEDYNIEWEVPDLFSPYCLIKVECTDVVENVGTDQSDDLFAITPQSSTYDFEAGWNLISIPLDPEDYSLEALFDDDIESQYHVYDYDQERGFMRVDEIDCGPGYWLGTYENASLDLEGTAYIDTVRFDLDEGWNLIGDPLLWHTPIDCVLFRADETTYSFTDAVDEGLVQPVLYNWLATNNDYTEEDELQSWLGYWFSVLAEDVQMLVYPIVPTEEDELMRDEGTPDQWHLRIVATVEEAADRTTTLGSDAEATDGFDIWFDYPEPPVPPGGKYVTAYFRHNDWDPRLGRMFNKDIRSNLSFEQEMEWVMIVETSDEEEVTLSWSDIQETIPEDYRIILEDPEADRVIDLSETDSYSYLSVGERHLTIMVTSFNSVRDNRYREMPTEFAIVEAYPNPFNQTTTIIYALPKTADVSLALFDLSGREVVTLIDGQRSAGYHTVIFDGEGQPAGVYILKLRVAGILTSHKVTLIK